MYIQSVARVGFPLLWIVDDMKSAVHIQKYRASFS
jgi:hypothetical protein